MNTKQLLISFACLTHVHYIACMHFVKAFAIECMQDYIIIINERELSSHAYCSLYNYMLEYIATYYNYYHSGYWSGNRTPIPMAIGPAIGHMQGTDCKRQSDSCIYFVLCCLGRSKELGCCIAFIFEFQGLN